MGLPVADLAPAPDLEDWYANLLWFDRRKCPLLTHSATLFTIFEADVTVPSASHAPAGSGADRAQSPGPKSERGTVARTCCW
jgi:hypothetical protein